MNKCIVAGALTGILLLWGAGYCLAQNTAPKGKRTEALPSLL